MKGRMKTKVFAVESPTAVNAWHDVQAGWHCSLGVGWLGMSRIHWAGGKCSVLASPWPQLMKVVRNPPPTLHPEPSVP